MKQEEEKLTGLPENAFRELKPGEVYNPLMSPDKKYPEVNLWSVLWGIAMAILFSAAAAYLGLKVGQVFEGDGTRRVSRTDWPRRQGYCRQRTDRIGKERHCFPSQRESTIRGRCNGDLRGCCNS